MRFALVNDVRKLPSQGLIGKCPICSTDMIAKCGSIRVHHWAHKAERNCDSWWERETEWHRAWKMHFPDDWQEVIHYGHSGEKHIADVKTPQGLTIEFQHSHMPSEERSTRENFYSNIIWVVNGLRLVGDLPRFNEGVKRLRYTHIRNIYMHHIPKKLFPKNWLENKVPVFFDFGDEPARHNTESGAKSFLWWLFPHQIDEQIIVARMPKKQFIRIAQSSPELFWGHTKLPEVKIWYEDERRTQEETIIQQQRGMISKSSQWYKRGRRF